MISFSWVPPDFIAVGKQSKTKNCFKMLRVDVLTFITETKSWIFCSVLDSALWYLSTKQGNPKWTTDYSAGAEQGRALSCQPELKVDCTPSYVFVFFKWPR